MARPSITLPPLIDQTAELDKNPILREFFRLELSKREIIEDGMGNFFFREVRKDRDGERLLYTYPLDTLHRGE